jgi:hypothetical protein
LDISRFIHLYDELVNGYRVISALLARVLTLGLTEKKRWVLRIAAISLAHNANLGWIAIGKNISSFISIPCSFIYGVFPVQMLP